MFPLNFLGLFGKLFGFLSGHPQLAAILGLALALGVTELRLTHAKSDLTTLRKANAEAEAQSRVQAANAAKISDTARKTLDQRQAQIIVQTRTLIQKVPVYVPASADRDCVVPLGFVRLHDAAAQGLPAPASGPDQAPSGIPLSAVSRTVIENYGIALGWRDEAQAWRDWYVKQAQNAGAK